MITWYYASSQCHSWDYLKQQILDNRRYVNGWCIRKELLNGSIKDIVVAYDNKTAVGCFTLTYAKHAVFGSCYVKPKYRRQGIGKALYGYMKLFTEKEFKVGEGIKGSARFWKECGESVIRSERDPVKASGSPFIAS